MFKPLPSQIFVLIFPAKPGIYNLENLDGADDQPSTREDANVGG